MWAATVDGGRSSGMAGWRCRTLDNQHVGRDGALRPPRPPRAAGIGAALLDDGRRAQPRGRADGADGLAVLTRRPAGRRRGDPDGPRVRARHRGDASRSATSRRPRPTWPALAAEIAAQHAGYRLEAWQERVPDAFVEGYCLPRGGVHRRGPDWATSTSARGLDGRRGSRKRDDRFVATGRHQFGVLAYAADGTCVATTELFVNEVAYWRALQGGTLVLPGHRGHRLGLAVKLVNLRPSAGRYPTAATSSPPTPASTPP